MAKAETTIAIGLQNNVLTVEGKTLTLSLDYADLNNNHLEKQEVTDINFDTMTVGSVDKLNKADDVNYYWRRKNYHIRYRTC